jgi:hypothetical protein
MAVVHSDFQTEQTLKEKKGITTYIVKYNFEFLHILKTTLWLKYLSALVARYVCQLADYNFL